MDPKAALERWLDLTDARISDDIPDGGPAHTYNAWIDSGGTPARIQVHPASDAWLYGDRCGDVRRLDRNYAHVAMDRSGRTRKVPRDLIGKIL